MPKVWILQKPMSGEERPSLCTNAFFSFVNKLPCNFLWKFKAPILFYLHVKLTVVVPMYLRRGRCWYFKPSHSSYRYLLWVSFMSSILAWDAYDFIFLSQKLRRTFTKFWIKRYLISNCPSMEKNSCKIYISHQHFFFLLFLGFRSWVALFYKVTVLR